MTEKRVTLIMPNGTVRKVAEHLVKDMLKFGAMLEQPASKKPPAELLSIIPKKIVLPEVKPIANVLVDTPIEVPVIEPASDVVEEKAEVKVVRRKTKKK